MQFLTSIWQLTAPVQRISVNGRLRRCAAFWLRRQVTVIHQTRELFLEGLTLYEARSDKEYSLTDCISMQVMRREGLTEVLTNDHHFTQEGFHILFP
jgi:predicted nucleic acid-binding protein